MLLTRPKTRAPTECAARCLSHAAILETLARVTEDLPDAWYTLAHRAERDEHAVRGSRDQTTERRLPRPRRPPENGGANRAILDRLPKRLAGGEDVRLSHVLIERARTKPSGERLRLVGA